MSDILSTDPDHSGVTDTQLEEFASTYFNANPPEFLSGQTGDPPVGGVEDEPGSSPTPPAEEPDTETGAPQEGEPSEGDDPSAEPPPSTEPPEDFYEFDGQRYPKSAVEAAARFQRQLSSDPDLQLLIQTYLAGPPVASTPGPASPAGDGSAPAGPSLTELDLDDPSIRALVTRLDEQSNAINELRSGLQASVNVQQQRMLNETQSLWKTASDMYAKDHGLETNDIDHLSSVAARLGVLPQLMQGMDPVTGVPTAPDPVQAFYRSLDIAAMMVPEYRDRAFRRSVEQQQEEAKKRKLLGAVGGSSGSVARTQPPPRPGSPEARNAMIKEVAEAMNGSWSDPAAN